VNQGKVSWFLELYWFYQNWKNSIEV
jgi:hypothetical protein